MPTGFAVDSDNQLQEFPKREILPQPVALRILGNLISYIFHPVFVPIYAVAFLLYIHPYLFAGFSSWDKSLVLIQAIVNLTFFPLVTVGLLKALKFIKSIHLETQKDRVIPFIACGMWYFWIWYVWHHTPEYPVQLPELAMGIFLASVVGLLLNIYMKVSLHAISMGVIITFMVMLAFQQPINAGIYLSVTLLIAGLVCTARLIVSDHTQSEIYMGLFAGVVSQLIGLFFNILLSAAL